MRVGVAAVVAAALLAACGDGGAAGPGTSPGPAAASGSGGSPASTPTPAAALAVDSPYGRLPLPTELAALEAALKAMPPKIGGAARKPGGRDSVSYAAGGAALGLEAADVEDVARGGGTAADAFERLRHEFAGTPAACAEPPARCLTGRGDGGVVLAWGHDDGPFVVVALAPDRARLTALLRAWQAVAS